MATSNEILLDQLVSHQIELIRFGKGLSNRIKRLLNQVEPELRRTLRARLERIAALGYDPGPATTRRLQRLEAQIKAIQAPTWEEINALVRSELVGLAQAENVFMAGVVSQSLPVLWEPALPTGRQLRAIVFARPIQNRLLKDWLSDFQANDRRRMMDSIRQGLVFGETPTQIGRRIWGTQNLQGTDGDREISRRGAQVLAQTATASIALGVHQELYKRNRRVIRREKFVATLDSRTTPICRALDGGVYPVGEGPIPPVHINCRSVRVPVIDGRQLGNRPATTATRKQLAGLRGPARRRAVEKLTGRVPAETTFQTWLTRQSAGFQDELLGPARGALFRRGDLTLQNFVDNSGNQYTLRQLYERNPRAFQKAGLEAPRLPDAPRPEN